MRTSIALALAALLAVACGTSGPSSGDPSASPGSPASGQAGSPAPSDSATDLLRPPNLLIAAEDGSFAIVDPLQPAARRRLRVPAGAWAITTGPALIAAYATDPAGPTRIVVGRVLDDGLVVEQTLTTPGGDLWAGAYPACLNRTGTLIVADAGLQLWLANPGVDPVLLPDQRDNRGSCVWLDDAHVVWDEEGGGLALFDLVSRTTVQVEKPPVTRSPSGGGGRVAGMAADGSLVVSTYRLDDGTLTIDPPTNVVPNAAGELSGDGRWLVARSDDVLVVTRQANDALGSSPPIEIDPRDRVTWLPPPSP